jgi:glucose/arabinose dehydrogenase
VCTRASHVVLLPLLALACSSGEKGEGAEGVASLAACADTATGITVPAGFCATVFADSIGHARQVVVAPNGDVYVNTWSGAYYPKSAPPPGGFLVALRDTNRDGRADIVQRFGETSENKGTGGVGLALYNGALFAEAGPRILRYALDATAMAPSAAPDTVITGLPTSGDHPQHSMAIDSSGILYVQSGSASNSCQIKERTAESKGKDPCRELETRGGVWRYDAKVNGQRYTPKERFATGIRNAVGMTIGPDGALWTTQHGRDQLAENWPKLYTPEQGQQLPAEELMRVTEGDDFGWPYCYYDGDQKKRVLAPEYGGDGGTAVGRCADKKAPAATFPAHWAPNAVVFYTGTQYPERYRGGAFVAFHGSWNRTPGPQGGYNVVFQPMAGGSASGGHEVFADGFAGATVQPDRATYRPAGVAMGGDGALYVTDDVKGRVWRITYGGGEGERLGR